MVKLWAEYEKIIFQTIVVLGKQKTSRTQNIICNHSVTCRIIMFQRQQVHIMYREANSVEKLTLCTQNVAGDVALDIFSDLFILSHFIMLLGILYE